MFAEELKTVIEEFFPLSYVNKDRTHYYFHFKNTFSKALSSLLEEGVLNIFFDADFYYQIFSISFYQVRFVLVLRQEPENEEKIVNNCYELLLKISNLKSNE